MSASTGSQSATSDGSASDGRDIGRVGDDQVERPPRSSSGSASNQEPSTTVTPAPAIAQAGQVGPGDGHCSARGVDGPHRGARPLGGDRQPDRTAARSEVGHRGPSVVRTAVAPVRRRRVREMTDAVELGQRCSTTCSVSGRGISTRRSTSRSRVRKPQRPSTYCSGSPADRRSSMRRRSGRPPARSRTSSRLQQRARRPRRPTPPRRCGGRRRSADRKPAGRDRCVVVLEQRTPRRVASIGLVVRCRR